MKRTRARNDAPPRRGKQKLSKRSTRDESEEEDHGGSSPNEEVTLSSEDDEPTQKQSQRQIPSNRRGAEDSDGMDELDGSLDFTQPDYAMQASYSQPTGSQENESAKTKPPSVPAKVGQLSSKAIDDLTSQLVRYMLYKAGLKLPIRFADISKEVYPKHKNVSRYFFGRAKQQLENVFGYQVVPVDDSSSKEIYIILNGASSQEHLQLVNKNGRTGSRGLLMMILGILWCAQGRQLSEDDLWKQLALVDSTIKPNKEHRQLGDVAQLIKTFENQMYLSSTSDLDADLKKVKHYTYGARTLLEVGKVQILNFVCKLVTGRPPTEMQIDEVNLESA